MDVDDFIESQVLLRERSAVRRVEGRDGLVRGQGFEGEEGTVGVDAVRGVVDEDDLLHRRNDGGLELGCVEVLDEVAEERDVAAWLLPGQIGLGANDQVARP